MLFKFAYGQCAHSTFRTTHYIIYLISLTGSDWQAIHHSDANKICASIPTPQLSYLRVYSSSISFNVDTGLSWKLNQYLLRTLWFCCWIFRCRSRVINFGLIYYIFKLNSGHSVGVCAINSGFRSLTLISPQCLCVFVCEN